MLQSSLNPVWASLAIVAAALFFAGCGEVSGPALERFAEQWRAAIDQRAPERLYPLLDAASRQDVRRELQILRGLSEQEQQRILDWLGGERVASLKDMSPSGYFGRLWDRATQGVPPEMRIRAEGERAAVMELSLGDAVQEIPLMVEGGRWVWKLPEGTSPPSLPDGHGSSPTSAELPEAGETPDVEPGPIPLEPRPEAAEASGETGSDGDVAAP